MSRGLDKRTRLIIRHWRFGFTVEEICAQFGITPNALAQLRWRHKLASRAVGQNGLQRQKSKPTEQSVVGAAPAGPPPPPAVGSRISPVIAHARWPHPRDRDVREQEEFNLRRSVPGCAVLVPSGALVSNGERAWRCTEVGR